MKKNFFSNLGLKIMSVLVAFLIWLMVVNGDDPISVKSFADVEIKVQNADVFIEKVKQVYKPRKEEDTVVTVYVKARRSVWSKLDKNSFTVTADFENINDMNAIPLEITCTSNQVKSEDMWCASPSFKVELESVKEASYVILVKEDGTPASGYEVGKKEPVQGDSLSIAGPESDMRKIDKVIATITLGGLKEDKRLKGTISIMDKNGDPFKESQMKRLIIKTSDGKVFEKNEIDVDVELWKVRKDIIPVVEITGNPANGYQVDKVDIVTSPETLSLVGSEEVLSSLEGKLNIIGEVSVEGASESFPVDIDLKEYLEENYGKELRIEADVSEKLVVTVPIEKIGTSTLSIPVSEIEVKGQPEDMTRNLTPADAISIEIQPLSVGAPELKAADVKVVLDLSNYKTAGDFAKVPLAITLPEGYVLVSETTIAVSLVKIEETNTLVDQ